MRFPFAERASLGCHAEFRPSAARALAASACFVECLCVPFGAGFARCFAGGECFGWGGGEAGASEAARRFDKPSHYFHLFARHEKTTSKESGYPGNASAALTVCPFNDPLIIPAPTNQHSSAVNGSGANLTVFKPLSSIIAHITPSA
jgi:hypothetical protein